MRQQGVSHIIDNFVAGSGVGGRGSAYRVYSWTPGQLMLLRDFMKRHTEIAVAPRHVDSINGGYYVYRVVARPAHAPGLVYYLPGITEVIWHIHGPLDSGRPLRARALALSVSALLPDVGVFRLLAAIYAYMGRDFKSAEAELRRLAEAGMVGEFLHGYWGEAALEAHDAAGAIRAFEVARGLYPADREVIDENEARAYARLSLDSGEKAGDFKAGLAYAEKATGLCRDDPAANLSLAVACFRLGRVAEARRIFGHLLEHERDDAPMQAACRAYLKQCGLPGPVDR
jgi:tetratricopeptide (TPR) repeat protein